MNISEEIKKSVRAALREEFKRMPVDSVTTVNGKPAAVGVPSGWATEITAVIGKGITVTVGDVALLFRSGTGWIIIGIWP